MKVKRFWEVDSLRGIAIVMMVVFHLLFDLNYFGGFGVSLHSGFWLFFGRATAMIFLFLVGVSLTLSYSRVKGKPEKEVWMKYLKRGVRIFIYGLVITLVTYLFFDQGVIVFGVLHLIGLAIVLSRPFQNLGRVNILLGIAVIIIGLYVQGVMVNHPWLLWLGLMPGGFYTFDYFPILPWFGVVLLGMFSGKLLYPGGKRGFRFPEASGFPVVRFLNYLGRHSLLIYFIHQPVLIALLYLLVL
jgi:uncharacterized membrane protein